MSDYYIPKTRWKVFELLTAIYPGDAAKFRGMKTRQLFAIYHSVQKRRNTKMITPEAQKQIDELNQKIKTLEAENNDLKAQIAKAKEIAEDTDNDELFEGIFD